MNSKEKIQLVKEKLPTQTAVVMINPNAGPRRKNKRVYEPGINKVTAFMRDRDGLGLDVRIVETTDTDHARSVVEESIDANTGLIVSKGGDGSNAGIVYMLAKSDSETQLAILGGGTQNVVQNEFVKGSDPWKIFKNAVLNGRPKQIDLGIIQNNELQYPFLASTDIGTMARTLKEWDNGGKKVRLGMWPHFQRERKKTPHTFSAQFGDKEPEIHNDTAILAVQNFGPYGGFLRLTDNKIDDGILEALFIQPNVLSHPGLASLLLHEASKLKKESGIERRNFEKLRVDVLTHNPNEYIIFQHDGETQATKDPRFQIYAMPKAATVWVPKKSKM